MDALPSSRGPRPRTLAGISSELAVLLLLAITIAVAILVYLFALSQL